METRTFLAGKRYFAPNGVPFIVLFGLSPFENQIYHIFECELTKSKIYLGNFLTAAVTPMNSLNKFKKISYPIEVNVIEHSAMIKFSSAEATRDQNGTLIFQTRAFGPIPSLNQYLPLGLNEIVIKGSDIHPIKLFAEARPTVSLHMLPPVSTSNFYESARVQLTDFIPSSLSRKVTQSGFINLPVPSLDANVPKPTSSLDSSYNYIPFQTNSIPSLLPKDTDETSKLYQEFQNCSSSKPVTEEETLSELIEKLPKLDINESKSPTPKPRKVFPGFNQKAVDQQQKPILSVKPTKKVVFKLPETEVEAPEMGKTMRAFVHSYLDQFEKRIHFIWICDIMENSIFGSPNYELELGHFFEGVFQKQSSGKWECISYEQPIPPLIKGSIVFGKIELKAKISFYQPASKLLKHPQVYVKHLGIAIDQKLTLPPYCNGKVVKIQRLQFGKEKQYKWIITGLA